MRKFLNFLNRNLTKILWTATILVWVGVGIYYFSTYPSSFSLPFTSQESLPPTPTVSELLKKTESIPESIIGYFKEWEDIQDSEDKYILLIDRLTGQLLSKVRVILGGDSLYNESLLLSVKITVEEDESGETANLYPVMEKITPQKFEELVKPGDTVKVFLGKVGDKENVVLDQNGHFLAEKVWIVREE